MEDDTKAASAIPALEDWQHWTLVMGRVQQMMMEFWAESLKKDPNIKVMEGPETRVVYLGFDEERNELVESNVKGKNPYKDKRVREAMFRSIDIEAIKRTVMRGQSFPTMLMVAPPTTTQATAR